MKGRSRWQGDACVGEGEGVAKEKHNVGDFNYVEGGKIDFPILNGVREDILVYILRGADEVFLKMLVVTWKKKVHWLAVFMSALITFHRLSCN